MGDYIQTHSVVSFRFVPQLLWFWRPHRILHNRNTRTIIMSSARKITLKSSDGEIFEVDEAVALESQTIKHMIEDDCADSGIPLPNVNSKILSKVIEYCKKHVESPKPEDRAASVDDDLKTWDTEFVKVDQATLFDLILVCRFLPLSFFFYLGGSVFMPSDCLFSLLFFLVN